MCWNLNSGIQAPSLTPRETGILMLADSVEAASRSINEPTHKRLETMIDGIFKARVNDGQLDDTELDIQGPLSVSKETFLEILLGIHHGRVKYPGQEEKEQEEAEQEPSDSGEEQAGREPPSREMVILGKLRASTDPTDQPPGDS